MKKKTKSKSPIQIIAAIGLVIAILWTAKGFFEFGKAGYKEINSSKSNTKTEIKKAEIVNLNCRWLNGQTVIGGYPKAISAGMPGTHDISISLSPDDNSIIRFEGFAGFQADINIFNQNEIVWKYDDSKATWRYRLSRMSGSLSTEWIQKSNQNRIFQTYQCSKSEQKF